ncbi:hypothetical protein GCM10027443_17740 [Pontibacter brevis]
MKFEIEKPKTRKGLSYVLKSSFLKDAITSRGLDCNVVLVYRTPGGGNTEDCSLIDAEYWVPNQNVDEYRFYIRAGVVPSTERKKVEAILLDEVLSRLVDWMASELNQPPKSTKLPGKFRASYRNGELVLNR